MTFRESLPQAPNRPRMLSADYQICLAAFLLDFSVMIGMTVLPFYIYNQIGGGAALSGAIGASQAAFYAIFCLVSAGFVSRAKNGIHWALCGMTVFTVASCALPVFRGPLMCGIIATVSASGLALVWPALHAWVGAEPEPRTRAKRMALFNVSWSFGFAVSPLVAGPLYDYDYRWPFVLLFLVAALTIALLRALPHEKEHFTPATEEVLVARADHDRASEAYLYAGWCAALVGSVLATVTRNVYPKRIDELVAAGQLRVLFEAEPFDLLTRAAATKYSWLAFALALTAAVSFLVLGRTRRWQHNFQYLVWLQIAGAAAFWVLGNTRSLVVMSLCFIITGALAGVSFFTGVYYSMADPAHKHRRAAINEGAVGAGGFAGSMAFGYLAERFDLATPFHYTPVFIVLALVVQFLLLRYGLGRPHAQETP